MFLTGPGSNGKFPTKELNNLLFVRPIINDATPSPASCDSDEECEKYAACSRDGLVFQYLTERNRVPGLTTYSVVMDISDTTATCSATLGVLGKLKGVTSGMYLNL